MSNAYNILLKIDKNRLFGTPEHIWEGSIKVDLKEVVCEVLYGIYLVQNRNQLTLYYSEVIFKV
jgi:hypothetical protein